MEKELRAEDLFVTKQNTVNNSEYIATVKLSSCGRLGLPAVLHVKDYSFADTVLLAKISSQNESKIILSVLKNVIYEDIDVSKVTAQDALEILMTIQGTFYSAYLDGLTYFINEDLKGAEKMAKENISTATIPISDIKTIPLNPELKTPICLETNTCKVKFDYPRLIHDSIALDYIDNLYAEKDNQMSLIKQKMKNHSETVEEITEYEKYRDERFADLMKAVNALQIIEYNGKRFTSLDEQMKVIDKIPAALITLFTAIINERFKFGIDPEVTFIDNETEKSITRRFNFRFSQFLQTLEYKNADSVRIQFGE